MCKLKYYCEKCGIYCVQYSTVHGSTQYTYIHVVTNTCTCTFMLYCTNIYTCIYIYINMYMHMYMYVYTLIICHKSPSTRWGLPSIRSWGPIFTILHPIEEAELIARVWFSWIVNLLSFPLLIVRSSIVLGTDVLISLLYKEINNQVGSFVTLYLRQ